MPSSARHDPPGTSCASGYSTVFVQLIGLRKVHAERCSALHVNVLLLDRAKSPGLRFAASGLRVLRVLERHVDRRDRLEQFSVSPSWISTSARNVLYIAVDTAIPIKPRGGLDRMVARI